MAIAVIQSANVVNSTANATTSYTGSSFTVGTGDLLVALIFGYLEGNATSAAITSLDFGGNAMSVQIIGKATSTNRSWLAIAILKSPPTGANTVSLVTAAQQRAMRIDLLEISGADLTTTVTATLGSGATSENSRNIAIAVADADSLIISGVAIQADAGTITGSNGVTIVLQGATGTAAFSDTTGVSGYESIATPGTTGHDYSWTTTNTTAYAAIVVKSAAAGGITGSASGSIGFTGASAGAVTIAGQAAGTIGFTGTANGAVTVAGQATGSLLLTGSATGQVAVAALASGALPLSGSATGLVGSTGVSGVAAGALPLTGAATARAALAGQASGEMAFAGASSGKVAIAGAASSILALLGTAAGGQQPLYATGRLAFASDHGRRGTILNTSPRKGNILNPARRGMIMEITT